MKIFSECEISNLLPTWKFQNNSIEREFLFDDFKEAFCFMTKIAFHAEINDHHPEWTNVYNKLVIRLITHELAGITQKDIELASLVDQIYDKRYYDQH